MMKIYVTKAGACKSVVISDDAVSVVIDGGATDAYAGVIDEQVTPSELLTLLHIKDPTYLICTMPDVEQLAGLNEVARTTAPDYFVIGKHMLEWFKDLVQRTDLSARGKEVVRLFMQLQATLLRKNAKLVVVSPAGLHLALPECGIDCAEEVASDGVPCLNVKISWDEQQLTLGAAVKPHEVID